jgi:hypothetical protein
MGPPGHFGVAFAAKKFAPNTPLWALLVASEGLDLLSAGFLAAGMEKMAATKTDFSQGLTILEPSWLPWSHGLFMSLVWTLAAVRITYLISKNQRISLVTGLVVFSHWILDFIVHAPDLPLFFGESPLLGLRLWTSGPGFIASILLEIIFLVGGFWLYRKNKAKIAGRVEV